MTWEELMGMKSTTGYDIWSEDVLKTKNYRTSTNEGRHFKTQSNYSISTNGGRHFKSQANNTTSTNGGIHFKAQDTDPNDLTKIAHITRGETLQTPTFGD